VEFLADKALGGGPLMPLKRLCFPGESFRKRLSRGSTFVRADADWQHFAGTDWLSRIMDVEIRDRFHAKQGRTIARWTLIDSGGSQKVVYLKRHYCLPRWHGWMALFFPHWAWSPGRREYENLGWARSQGLPVPRTPAVGEFLGPWGRLQSFLAVEELSGMVGLHEAIPAASAALPPQRFAAWKQGLIAELARLSRELHRRRMFHKDLYLCHFYISEADTQQVPDRWQGRVMMIDFHRLARHRWLWPWWLAKDLAQLAYSSDLPGITARDRLRFWRVYRRGDWGAVAAPPRVIAWLIYRKWTIYERNRIRREKRIQE
jgi:hypothetical protein